MRGLEIRILDLGCLATVGEELVAGMGNEPFSSPVSAVLIRHPEKGYILCDTGNDEEWRNTYPEAAKKSVPCRKIRKDNRRAEKRGGGIGRYQYPGTIASAFRSYTCDTFRERKRQKM